MAAVYRLRILAARIMAVLRRAGYAQNGGPSDHAAAKGAGMSQTDKILVIAALILGVLDVLNIRSPLSRFSAAGIAIVLLAVVELHRGGVFSY
jgi:hypothetical protein